MNESELEHFKKLWGPPKAHEVRYARLSLPLKGKLIRCPGYNANGVSIYGWCYQDHIPTHRKPRFQEALRKSIAKEGVRNPIVAYALREGDFLSFGGSRLRAAYELGLDNIPAIVNDYCGRYRDCPLVTEDNYDQFFKDVPQYFEFTVYGAETHYSLERNRRHSYDPRGFSWLKNVEDTSFVAKEFSWITDYTEE